MRIIGFVSILVCGCQQVIQEDEFINFYAQERCAKIFSCVSEEEQESLTSIYGSQEECSEAIKSELASSLEGQDLEYSASQATQCIDFLQLSSCDEEEGEDDPCSNVYTQPN